jgi:hypothetical protein
MEATGGLEYRLVPLPRLLALWEAHPDLSTTDLKKLLYTSKSYADLILEFGLCPPKDVSPQNIVCVSYWWSTKLSENRSCMQDVVTRYKLVPGEIHCFMDFLSLDQSKSREEVGQAFLTICEEIYKSAHSHVLLTNSIGNRLWCFYEICIRFEDLFSHLIATIRENRQRPNTHPDTPPWITDPRVIELLNPPQDGQVPIRNILRSRFDHQTRSVPVWDHLVCSDENDKGMLRQRLMEKFQIDDFVFGKIVSYLQHYFIFSVPDFFKKKE